MLLYQRLVLVARMCCKDSADYDGESFELVAALYFLFGLASKLQSDALQTFNELAILFIGEELQDAICNFFADFIDVYQFLKVGLL